MRTLSPCWHSDFQQGAGWQRGLLKHTLTACEERWSVCVAHCVRKARFHSLPIGKKPGDRRHAETLERGRARGPRVLPGSGSAGLTLPLWRHWRQASWPCLLEAASLHLVSLGQGPVSGPSPSSGHHQTVTKCQILRCYGWPRKAFLETVFLWGSLSQVLKSQFKVGVNTESVLKSGGCHHIPAW